MRGVKYRAAVLNPRGNATGIEVPADVLDALGAGKRPLLQVTVARADGSTLPYTWTTTPGSMGGAVMIPLSSELRTAAGLAAGDEIDVELAVASEPAPLAVPEDLATAVAAAGATAFFEGLAPSHRKEWVRWVEEAKKADTRASRVAQAAEALAAGKPRR
ncbi:protein of unknown function [Quadrisphaera granulorum]|uniref:Uncharacterized protein DUF1905 n=1 Tax=Quadrisphaera granulorum TaxID=317664 RepID=A0A316ACM2_9ACTN|nr:YdeI/OmpD-associated family protein [Quadrisphaera granulorum]PWJ55391.1 uncharacterized protein DUF1905 [Quadrisphaera granulorum]SZE95455.1 protein of unknown function [Quadrisphaera granulorum]